VKSIEELTQEGVNPQYQTAGRVMLHRSMGKLTFATIKDQSGSLQVCFMKDVVKFNTGRPLSVIPAKAGISTSEENFQNEMKRDPATSAG